MYFFNAVYFSGEPDAAEMKCDLRERPREPCMARCCFGRRAYGNVNEEHIFHTAYLPYPSAGKNLFKEAFLSRPRAAEMNGAC